MRSSRPIGREGAACWCGCVVEKITSLHLGSITDVGTSGSELRQSSGVRGFASSCGSRLWKFALVKFVIRFGNVIGILRPELVIFVDAAVATVVRVISY